LFCGTVCKLRLVFGLQLVLFVGVAVADMEVDVVAGVELFVNVAVADVEVDVVAGVLLFVSRDGVPVAACVLRSADAECRRCGGRRGGGRRGGGGAICPAGRCASCGLCLACSWCCLSASRCRTWRWTW